MSMKQIIRKYYPLADKDAELCKNCPKVKFIDSYIAEDEAKVERYSCSDELFGNRIVRENCIHPEIATKYKQAYLDHCIKIRDNMVKRIPELNEEIEKYSKLVT
jgi:hypothetical protein